MLPKLPKILDLGGVRDPQELGRRTQDWGIGVQALLGALRADSAALHAEIAALDASVTSTLAGYVTAASLTSTLASYQLLSAKGAASGYASLDGSALVPIAQLPTGSTSSTVCIGNDSRLSDARTPTAHATSHKSGGTDAIKLDELSAPTDVTTLNASTTAHGLLRKLDGSTSNFLRGDGTWAAPSYSLTIGSAVTGGTAGRILYEGAGPVLADSSSLKFDSSAIKLSVGIGAAKGALNAYASGASNPWIVLEDGDVTSLNWSAVGYGIDPSGNVVGVVGGVSATGGGMGLFGYSNSNSIPGLQLIGHMGASPVAGNAAVSFQAFKHNGTTGRTAIGSTEVAYQFAAGSTDILQILGNGAILAQANTAIPAGGTAGLGLRFSSTSNFGSFYGSGAPSLSSAQGSLYLRSDGVPYYNSSSGSGTTWTALETTSAKDASNGYCGLNASSKVALSKLALSGSSSTYLRSDGTEATPSASIAIGGSVTSGTAGRILYEGAGPVLADSANLKYDATNVRLSVGAGAAKGALNAYASGTLNPWLIIEDGDVTSLNWSGVGYNVDPSGNVVGQVGGISSTAGGLALFGFGNSNSGAGVQIIGHCGASPAAGNAVVSFQAFKHNGTTGRSAVSGTEVAYQFAAGSTDVVQILGNGTLVVQSSTAIPAGGTAGIGLRMSSTSNFGVFFGSGAPSLSAAKGSLYLRSDGSGTSDRMYVNTNGSTTWTAVTTAA